MAAIRRLSSAKIPVAGGALTTRRLSSSQLSDTAARRLSVESLSLSPTIPYERRPSGGPLTPRPTLTPTNTPANLNALLAPPSMPRRASTYHDTEKANSGELDNSGGFVSGADIIRRERGVPAGAVDATSKRRNAVVAVSVSARWRSSRRSTGKNRPLGRELKPTLPRVLSRANASVVDEE